MSRIQHIQFHASAPFTLGVEVEFQLLDKSSLNLSPSAPLILATVPPHLNKRIKHEFIQSMIEVNTDICTSVQDVEKNLTELLQLTEMLAQENDCSLYATSLHPFAFSRDQLLSSDPRYVQILDDLQIVGRRFIAQGLHVHVGLPDGETAIRICDIIRLYLPILLALTASSPYYEGQDTGLQSYRSKLFETLPLTRTPDHLGDWSAFQKIITMLIQSDIIKQVRDLWWDVRPHPDFGTVEVRICDLPSRFDEILAMVALIQAIVFTLTRPGTNSPLNMLVLQSNKWQAVRYGLSGWYVDPLTMRKIRLTEAANNLIQQVAPAIEELGTGSYFAPLQRILRNGTSTDRQRQIYSASNDFVAVIKGIQSEFWQ